MSNDSTDRNTRNSSSDTGSIRNIGNVYYYTIDGKAFEAISADEEVTIAITIGIENKKEKED